MDRSRLIKACIIRAFGACLVVSTDTYVYMLFLSTYPNSYIPYLYLTMGLFAFISMRLTQPYLTRNLTTFMEVSHITFIVLLTSFIFLAHSAWQWAHFIIAVGILTTVAIGNTTDWIVVQSMFTLREFKKASKWISVTSTIAVVLIGLLIPLLLTVFPSSIVLIISICLFLGGLLVEKLIHVPTQIVEKPRTLQVDVPVQKQPLYLYTFFVLLIMLQLFIFSDFTFKSQLAIHFDKTMIGQFLAPFYAVTNLITILTQMFLAPVVLRRFGVTGLIMICPILFIIASGALFISPTLWSATIMAGVANVLRYSFFTSGSQMIYNVYPPSVRNLTQYQMQSFGRGLGVALGGITLIILGIWGVTLREVSASILFMAALMIYTIIQLSKYYFSTLKTAINLHRFDIDYLSTETTDEHMILTTANQALNDKSEDVLLFGLSLLAKIKLKTVPDGVKKALFSNYSSVEMAAINIIHASDDERVVPLLMKKLNSEKNPQLIEALVEAIVHFSADYLLPYAVAGIKSHEPAIKAASISVFLKSGTEEQIDQANNELGMMVNNSDPQYRYSATSVLSNIGIKNRNEYLYKLLNDSQHNVVENALMAASFQPDDNIIETVIKKLEDRSLTYSAGNTLVKIGESTLPTLVSFIHEEKNLYFSNIAIKLLSKFPQPTAEDALLKLLQTDNAAVLEICAISLAYRTRHYVLSASAQVITCSKVFEEVQKIMTLSLSESYYEDQDIKNEIQWRIYYAKKQYLYFLAACTGSSIILQIIPTLLMNNRASTAFSSAVELLELTVKIHHLKYTISLALEPSKLSEKPIPLTEKAMDTWLKQVFEFKQGHLRGEKMNELIGNILLLRKVSLFATLSAELLQTIASILQQRNIAANEIIFQQGDWGDGLYIVAKGSINIVQNGQLIRVCGQDSFFGELALLDDEPRAASAIASEDSKLFFVEKSEFTRLTDEVPDILRAVTKTVLSYLRHPTAATNTPH